MSSPLSVIVAGWIAPVAGWTAPAECPDADAVLAAAEEFGASVRDASLDLEGRIERVEGGYRLDLSIRTPTGITKRQLHAESCGELTRAAGLVLSVAIDPLQIPEPSVDPAASPVEPAALGPAETPTAPVLGEPFVPAPEPPRSPSDAPPSKVPMWGSVVASGTLGRGIAPALDGRAQLGLALDTPRVRAELIGFHAVAQRVDDPDRLGVGAKIRGWGGSLRVGPWWDVRGVILACPVGVEIAAVLGDGFGVDRSWTRADLAWGFVVAPGLRIPLGRRVAVGVDAELGVAVRRPAFAVAAPQALYRIPRIGARGGARIEVRFSGVPRDQNRKRRRPR